MPILYKDEQKNKMLFLQIRRCKGCDLCINICPNKALEKSTELNKNVQYPPKAVDGGKCTYCKLCEYVCPDFSIYVADPKEITISEVAK